MNVLPMPLTRRFVPDAGWGTTFSGDLERIEVDFSSLIRRSVN
jgi:hypothetical protein